MPYHDLNVLYPASVDTLKTLHELGYGVVAINVQHTGKYNAATSITNPVDVTALEAAVPGLKILTRLTLALEDKGVNFNLANVAREFDILAVQPTSEQTLQYACAQMEIDIISLDFAARLPFYLKFNMIGSAVSRHVALEISYTAAVEDSTNRRYLFSNASNLVRASRGRGLLISSGAKAWSSVRGPQDVANLATFWGLPTNRAVEALGESARRLVTKAYTRKSVYKGVMQITEAPQPIVQKRPPPSAENAQAQGQPMSKKQRKKLEREQQQQQVTKGKS